MIKKIVDGFVAALGDVVAVPVIAGYDQSKDPAAEQVVVTALADAEAAVRDGIGKVQALFVTVTARAVTLPAEDKNGVIRDGLAAAIFDYFNGSMSGLSIAGATVDGSFNATPGAVEPFGEQFLSVPTTVQIAVSIN